MLRRSRGIVSLPTKRMRVHRSASAVPTSKAEGSRRCVRLLRLAADQTHPDAWFYLGVCYLNGTGVDQHHAEAVRFYRPAADQGQVNAVATLARLGL
jgi:TPR repeat protein